MKKEELQRLYVKSFLVDGITKTLTPKKTDMVDREKILHSLSDEEIKEVYNELFLIILPKFNKVNVEIKANPILLDNLNCLLDFYEDIEGYENCAIIKRALNKIEENGTNLK